MAALGFSSDHKAGAAGRAHVCLSYVHSFAAVQSALQMQMHS